MNGGIIKMGMLEETLGAGTGRTAITKVMSEIDHLGRREGTLYSCHPIHDGVFGGRGERFVLPEEKRNKAFEGCK